MPPRDLGKSNAHFRIRSQAGQQVEHPQTIAVTALATDKMLLGANGVGGMMHGDRSLTWVDGLAI
jgi:hypothetical protein